ncbi:hypothetical protein Taro_035445 [Colocasia esculenta]|uniref:Uncharacterized protein n=1 Tax=Colocasia esculenta TaxID=4460 RepID=A0A843WIM2_COLES|nr:hypothetical protein [Colocasia esculenta]
MRHLVHHVHPLSYGRREIMERSRSSSGRRRRGRRREPRRLLPRWRDTCEPSPWRVAMLLTSWIRLGAPTPTGRIRLERPTPADPSLRRDRESPDCADRAVCLRNRPLPAPCPLVGTHVRGTDSTRLWSTVVAELLDRCRCGLTRQWSFEDAEYLVVSGLAHIRRDYSLPINVDDDDDDDSDPEFTIATRTSRCSHAEEDDRRRGLGTSGSYLSRNDSRRSLPRSTSVRWTAGALGCGGRLSDVHNPTQDSMDRYLYRSRSIKQPSIKQALKGVKATAKATNGAIKGGEV